MTPDFLIIGAMKAGTTSLAYQLDEHPDIAITRPKEPDFFSDARVWARGWDWYESCFAHAPGKPIRGDASTSYAKLPEYPGVVERLAEHRPDLRIVYMIRNPIDRAVSHYRHRWYGRSVPASCTFEDYLALDDTAVAFGCYWRQLDPYLQAFGAERVKVIVAEDYYADAPAVLRELCGFLGARADWQPERGEKLNTSESKVRKVQWLVNLRRSRLIPPFLRRLAPAGLREFIRNLGGRNSPPPVDLSACRAALLDRLEPEARRMSAFLGRDLLSLWKLDKPEARADIPAVPDRPDAAPGGLQPS